MSGLLKQSSTTQPLFFVLRNGLDLGATLLSGLAASATVTLSKNGGAVGSALGAITELGTSGIYKVAGNATDTGTVGMLALVAEAPGSNAMAYFDTYQVVAHDPLAAAVQLDLTQTVPTSNTAETLGDALNAARAQGFGKWVKSGTTLTLYAADNTTVVHTFTLNDATHPTTRT